jgi:phosphatidylserine/phosphatidylglycerophosphate/cardiolipin synthase-like enzyme
MAIDIRAHANCDSATIVWRTDKRIPDCRGFALYRQAKDAAGQVSDAVVETWVGFENDPQAQSGTRKPSTAWPIQRFLWSDYFADGLVVRYRVVPMLGQASNLKPADQTDSSSWSDWVTVATGQTQGIKAYFNRGIVASQWVARDLSKGDGGPQSALQNNILDPKSPLRQQLGGHLRAGLLALLATSQKAGEIAYAALYELNDPELISAMEAYGKRFNLILASGAFKLPSKDENAQIRAQLQKSDKITLHDRLVGGQHFAHNKFVVFCDRSGTPHGVWTGSTNWTVNGLCTQVNNGVLIENDDLAAGYKKRWDELLAAGNDYPPQLSQQGSTPTQATAGDWNVTAWNVPCDNFVDLADARRLIQGARQGVLFLMFNPGPQNTLLNDILALNDANLFVHGVVNQDPGGAKAPLLTFHDRGTPQDAAPEVVVPAPIKAAMTSWFKDEYRGPMVMIHSKVVVIDPFGSHPVVMTGSHNLGPKASSKNDDNLAIIENAPALAAEFAVNVLGVFDHYKWRHNQALAHKGAQAGGWKGLQDSDAWQDGYYSGAKMREIDFWFGDHQPAGPVPGSSAHGQLSGKPAGRIVRAPKAVPRKKSERQPVTDAGVRGALSRGSRHFADSS